MSQLIDSGERAEAHEQLGPPFVHRVGCGDEGVGTRACGVRENSLGGQRGEELASGIGGARVAQSGEAVQEDRGQGRVDAHCDLPRSGYSRTRASTGSSAAVAERNQEVRLGPARTPRERSIEALGTDAGEVERLARRLEAVSQRMADLLRRGVLEPSLAYAFLMKRGGQQVPEGKTKAKGRTRGRTRGRAPTNEGAVSAPDVSPPCLQLERPPIAFVRGETLAPSTARLKVRISRKSPASLQSSFSTTERKQ